MVGETEKEWILEAINHLKHRKARPDLSRISLRMKRKHQVTFARTKKLLDSLIEKGIVVKAVYKNNTSYRDVSKWKRGRLGGQILNSNKMLKRFVKAIEETEEDKGTGVSVQTIEHYLASNKEEKCFLSGDALTDALENEVKNGFLIKREVNLTTCYAVAEEKIAFLNQLTEEAENEEDEDHDDDTQDKTLRNQESHSSSDESNPLVKDILTILEKNSGKECVGATFNEIRQALTTGNISFTDTHLSKGLDECITKGHAMQVRTPQGKTCYVSKEKLIEKEDKFPMWNDIGLKDVKKRPAEESSPALLTERGLDPLITLQHSEEAQSMVNGSGPPLRPPSKRRRIMKDHGPDFEIEMPVRTKARFTESRETAYPTPVDSPVSEKSISVLDMSFKTEGKKKRGRPKKNERSSQDTISKDNIMEDENSRQGAPSEQSSVFNDDLDEESNHASSYPDVFNWTCDQVAQHFTDKGYVEEAKKMLEHELDGNALGLLKRSDIVGPPLGGMLGIKKLGVALKLFRDIRDLIYQGNAGNYMDPYQEGAFLRS